MAENQSNLTETAFKAVTGAGAAKEGAPEGEAGNFFRHVLSLAMTKSGDGLIDPKLVLSWLLTNAGVPSVLIGLLVPIREAGALLPQIVISNRIMAWQQRKWAWAGGSAAQGLAVAAILGAALLMSGWALGLAVCAALAVFAVARSFCSVSYKDVLGRTVAKSRRGTAAGLGASVASAGVIAFGAVLLSGVAERTLVVHLALALAALLWLGAGVVFAGMNEPRAEAQTPSPNPFRQFGVLRENRQLLRFVLARGCLVATALAPPYLILMASDQGASGFRHLGLLLFSSALASLISSYVWGRFADVSSRRVLIAAGIIAGVVLSAATLAGWAGVVGALWVLPALMFALMVAYHGVRNARSTYLVDMAPEDRRATYTAVANTVIGLILFGGGVFGLIASMLGPGVVVAGFGVLSFAGAALAWGLDEVETLAG